MLMKRSSAQVNSTIVEDESSEFAEPSFKALQNEMIEKTTLPPLTFKEIWKPMLARSVDDSYESANGLMGTMGVIAALIMSFIFGQNGKELEASINCIWGQGASLEFAR
jgi:hypothetical protein